MAAQAVIMPSVYHGIGKEQSDYEFVHRRMAVIPQRHQKAVAKEYVRRYLNKNTFAGRTHANAYLQGIATEYADAEARRGASWRWPRSIASQ